jgi:hypothetical protein
MEKNLGHATAYGYAKSKGYSGTEDEFAELMADYASVGQSAAQSASEAAASAASASGSAASAEQAAQTATDKASEAVTAADTATTKASEASQSASTASEAATSASTSAQTATTAAATATAKASEASESATTASAAKTDAESARDAAAQSASEAAESARTLTIDTTLTQAGQAADAKKTGDAITSLREDFTTFESNGVAPSAEQLLSKNTTADAVPYLFRPTGGNGADREYVDAIVGGTVNWNQLLDNMRGNSTEKGLTFANNNGALTISGTITEAFNYNYVPFTNSNVSFKRDGSKYFLMLNKEIPFAWGVSGYGMFPAGNRAGIWTNNSGGVWKNGLTFRANVGQTVDVRELRASIFDLTAMFGSTIADYIYSLEQSTAGAGVAFFRKLFPKDYYPYNSGELKSVEGVSAHETVGFNQFDKSTVLNGYIINDATGDIMSVSAGKVTDYISVISNQTYYIKSDQESGGWGAWYDADKNYISAITGYTKYGDNVKKLYTAPTNAHYMRLTCFYNNSGDLNTFCINLSDPTKNGTYKPYKAHSYPLDSTLTLRGIPKLVNGKMCFDGDVYEYTGKVTRNTILRAYQSGDESLENAITDGTNTVVYSANASTEQADPYQHLQQCDPNGTEEYVSTGIVPVGHETRYPENLRAKIEGLPWDFSSLIAPTEKTNTASRNYTAGSLLIMGNTLYKVTANIANGGTITPNTNVTATTLSEILSALAQ